MGTAVISALRAAQTTVALVHPARRALDRSISWLIFYERGVVWSAGASRDVFFQTLGLKFSVNRPIVHLGV